MKPWSYIWLEFGLFSTIIYIYTSVMELSSVYLAPLTHYVIHNFMTAGKIRFPFPHLPWTICVLSVMAASTLFMEFQCGCSIQKIPVVKKCHANIPSYRILVPLCLILDRLAGPFPDLNWTQFNTSNHVRVKASHSFPYGFIVWTIILTTIFFDPFWCAQF